LDKHFLTFFVEFLALDHLFQKVDRFVSDVGLSLIFDFHYVLVRFGNIPRVFLLTQEGACDAQVDSQFAVDFSAIAVESHEEF
jgi:hypothetical protein